MRMPVVALLLILLAPLHILAQQPQPPEDWSAVLGIKPNAPVKVISSAGRTIVGSFVTADAGGIVIDKRRGSRETVPRDEVREIRMRPKRSTAGSVGIGAVSGFAGGAILGAVACPSPCQRQDRAASAVLTGMFGTAVGSLVGLGRGAVANLRPGRLIYHSPPITP